MHTIRPLKWLSISRPSLIHFVHLRSRGRGRRRVVLLLSPERCTHAHQTGDALRARALEVQQHVLVRRVRQLQRVGHRQLVHFARLILSRRNAHRLALARVLVAHVLLETVEGALKGKSGSQVSVRQ